MKVGNKVKILECHSIPDLVGKEAKIVAELDAEVSKYPFQVMLTNWKMPFEHPILGKGETSGPFPFREDELELIQDTPLPEFLKDMDKPEQPA